MTLSGYLAKTGLSHSAFAALIGTSQAAVSRYVLGKRTPRPEHMARITEATGGQVTPNDFFGSPSVPNSSPENGVAA
ncbi:helix-turn-helix domain-containing protein [Hansschlegelia plantiphila]|uniref:HTH cro/C1-type domain-containing protein n=1 Tax=Hansschlegelia plantiphila TaxID=374655 RepID=A0A9W6J1Q9_9HYPH|nr:helix-turn-helix domain-containing protein [Hansschlegelia plantiphila]GLK69210.1 hypothetical protein GCM10008179_28480 [Hansschlegelia plantiphila]